MKGFGNAAFKANDLSLGLDKYQKGLRYLNEDPDLANEPEGTKETIAALRFALNNNSALLSNKLKDFKAAFESATNALEVAGIEPKEQAKGMYFTHSNFAQALRSRELDSWKDGEMDQPG